jgi:hypothetical protein
MLADRAFEWLQELTETSKRSGAGTPIQQFEQQSDDSIQTVPLQV